MGEHREFVLEPNRLRLFVKDFDGETETFVLYEKITNTTRTITEQDGRLYIAAISFGIFAVIGFALNFAGISALMRWAPLWAVASVIFFGFHFYKKRRYFLIDLSDNKSIFFLASQPSPEELKQFVQALYETRKRYLREHYYRLDPIHGINDEITKLRWLLSEEIITEAEFQALKTTLMTQMRSQAVDQQSQGLLN